MGLIATNTVAQGDTREVGLDRMVGDGFTIMRSIQSRSWPAASANLEYAAAWGTRGEVAPEAPRAGRRRRSAAGSPRCWSQRGASKETRSVSPRTRSIAFQGCIVLGMGFVLDPDEAAEWIDADPANADVLFPYLNGEDLNSRADASPSRWVIDFNDRSEAAARRYSLPYARVARPRQGRAAEGEPQGAS